MFSSPMIQMAESIFTVSVIMFGCFGSIALASKRRLRSSPSILCSPYLEGEKEWFKRYENAAHTILESLRIPKQMTRF